MNVNVNAPLLGIFLIHSYLQKYPRQQESMDIHKSTKAIMKYALQQSKPPPLPSGIPKNHVNGKIQKSIFLLAMLLFPGWAFAACSHGYGSNFPMPANIPVANNTPINGVILKHEAVFAYTAGVDWWFTCSETANRIYPYEVQPTGPLVTGNIYRSSDPRVGLRIAWGGKTLPIQNGRAIAAGFIEGGPFLRMRLPERNLPMVVELIKLKNIDSPVTLSGSIASINVPGNLPLNVASIHFQNTVVVAPPVPSTCRPIETSIGVAMGPVPSTSFTGVGSTAGDADFQILLVCAGGDDDLSTTALVTLSDAANPANTSDRLDLTRDSGARGIGVQVLRSGRPLRFGANAPGNPWLAGTAQGAGPSVLEIPLRARYVQTANAVVAGKANAQATITLSYR